VPLVDFTLLAALAPAIPALTPGEGKAALAKAPTSPLPNETVIRGKTGFGVPTGAWMNKVADEDLGPTAHTPENKGLISRRWSATVFSSATRANDQLEVRAS